ncbi:MAG: response regulator [Bacteroidales bacterium]|nr:response regulator [Bacteroidales bacterium]
MKNRVERRTSWKVVITYLFVIALCGAMFYFIYKIQGSIQNQKINISVQSRALDLTNQFTQLVHEAQSEANLFAFTDNPKHLKRFGNINNEINRCADSLLSILPSEENERRIREVERLILRKGQISYVLSRQFYYYDPLAEIDAKLQSYVPQQPSATTVTTVTQSDTIIHNKPKKNLWQRIGDVFNPEEDSIVQVSQQTVDTAMTLQNDSLNILEDLKLLSQKARLEYKQRIQEYEKKTAELIRDDNHLSEQISELLLTLNKEILDSSVLEIENSETLIKENSRSSTIIGGAVLVLIIIFIILILSDVSKGFRARQAAEKAKLIAEEAQRKTEELMETRHKMLLAVSHDIKTPLSSILGNLELMDNNGNEKEVVSIQQSADHILNLLGNLLEFSRLEQGKLQVEKKPFNVKALCDETASMFEPIAQKKNLVFDYKNDIRSQLIANSDRLKLKQIISNLISNAIKYTIEGNIGFRASLENGCLVYRVKDSGIGIPEDKLEDIFKPFVRIDNSSTLSEGSGYGLSVVKGLVDLMEGQIEVQSEVGKGSLFTVKIPVEIQLLEENRQSEEDQITSESDVSAVETIELVPQRHILIIDDDDTLLTVVSNMIGKLGHQVMICRSKNDIDGALQQVDTYDYILTDREMGALSGNDILKLFKKADKKKPVYLMTARMDYTNEIAQREGFDGFLQKPFNLKDLESLFGRHLQESPTDPSSSPAEGSEGGRFKDFPELCAMMGDDEEAIKGVLTVFAQSTADHVVSMNEAIEKNDFATAQGLCHKMLPMFIQLQQQEAIPFLSKMNGLRANKRGAREYPEWKDDAVLFMSHADNLLELLAERYDIV